MKHIKLKTVNLKNHPRLNERWLQDFIADDPLILGIGDVILKDKGTTNVDHIKAWGLDYSSVPAGSEGALICGDSGG